MLITPKLENRFIVHAFHLLHNFYARVHIFFSFLKSRLCVAHLDRNKSFYYSFRVSACIYGFYCSSLSFRYNSVQCSWDDLNIIYFSNYESLVILLPISMKLLLII